MNRVQIGYDPAGGADSIVFVEVQPRMHGFRRAILDGMVRANDLAAPRLPGELGEYPSRVEHARAHRLRSEIRRRDRRRARTGRDPIQPATYPKRRPLLPLAMRLRVADFAGFAAASGLALRAIEQAVTATRDAMRAFAASDPFREVREDLERSFVQQQAVVRTQARVDYESIVQLYAEAEQWDAERAAHRQAFERIRARTAVNWPGPWTTGGFVSPPRDPDDETILAFISPGEVYVPPAALERYGPGLFQRLNGPGPTYVYPLAEDDTHSVGEQNERDFRAVARTLGPPLGELPDAATWHGDVTHHDRYLGEGALDRDETSSVHSTDSSGTGAVWTDLMARIDDLVDGED